MNFEEFYFVREETLGLHSPAVCNDGGFKPPSALSSNDRRLKLAVFSNGVKQFIKQLTLDTASPKNLKGEKK
jgi:hypothetical protein